MEYFLLLIGVVVVIILLARRGSGNNLQDYGLAEKMVAIIDEIRLLRKEVKQLRQELDDSKSAILLEIRSTELHNIQSTARTEDAASPVAFTPLPALEELILPVIENQYHQPKVDEEVPVVHQEEIAPEPILPEIPEEPIIDIHDPVPDYLRPNQEPEQPQVVEHTAGYPENDTDIEKFIGENLINKVGIAILVLGIAFFVKYAIDKDWINEVGRVCIGLLCGSVLTGIAHFLRKNYRSFSSVLAGGGIAVYYFSIAFAFHQYHLMSQMAAFAIMVVITLFAIALSILYDRLELAVIAVIGGFITPFLVSTGDGNYQVLFTYLIILNAGTLALSYFKRWPLVNIISLAFTQIIFWGWLSSVMNSGKPYIHPVALAFAATYYVLFLSMNMINQLKNKDHFKAFDFGILLFISSAFYGQGMLILHDWNNGAYQGLFTLVLGIVNFCLSWIVYKQSRPDKNLLFLLIGITLTFITLTIPIQLHGHAITMFWSAEFVLLYWLSTYSGIRIYKYSSLLICILSVISLAMDWQHAGMNYTGRLHVIYTDIRGIITNLISIAAFGTYSYLLYREKDGAIAEVSTTLMARLSFVAAILLLYITCMYGVNLYYGHFNFLAVANIYHRIITGVFALSLLVLLQKKWPSVSPWIQLAFLPVCFLILLGAQISIDNVRNLVIEGKLPIGHLIFHWISALLFITLYLGTLRTYKNNKQELYTYENGFAVFMAIIAIVFISMELQDIFIMAVANSQNIYEYVHHYNKAGLTVVWALCSFAMMWLGMKNAIKSMRIIALILFGVVLLKLFVYDISDISEGGKILAFILLGVLLLVVSFMYQKLKKMIIDDKKENNGNE